MRLLKNRKGQGLIEYGLIAGLISVVLVVTLQSVASKLDGTFKTIVTKLP